MQFFTIKKIILLAAFISTASANSTPANEVQKEGQERVNFHSKWIEKALQRYRFTTNVADKERFLRAFRSCGGITSNWQAWEENGHGVFDDSEVQGIAGERVIACGIRKVTGQSSLDIGGIGCFAGVCP